MNYTLLRKELGGLRLILAFVAVIIGFDVCYLLCTGFLDRPEELDHAEAVDQVLENTIANVLLFGMLMGVQLIGQDREHNTRRFLDGLPVRPTTLFLHKLIAALLVIATIVIGLQSLDSLFEWMASDSLSPNLSLLQKLLNTVTTFLLSFAVVGVSTSISYSRQWFPLIAGLLVCTLILLKASESSWAQWVDSSEMLRWSLGEGSSTIPWKAIVGHLFIGTLGWLGALACFLYRDGWISRQVERASQWRVTAWLVAFGQLIAASVWLIAISMLSSDSESDAIETRAAGTMPSAAEENRTPLVDGFGRERTDYYEIVFRQSRKEDVDRYLGWLDTLHEQVRTFLGEPSAPSGRILIDTASPVMSHAAAQTNWTKIRLPIALVQDDLDFCRVLRHETAHVFIEQMSGGRATDQFNAMRVLHEGLASLAELADDPEADTDARREKERWACGVDSRGRVPFHILCDNARLVTSRDPDIVYPLGFILADAMLECGGPDLPKRFLTSLKDISLPPGAKPYEVWRIVLQKCNTSLDHLVANYEAKLDALAIREKGFLEGLPRLSVDAEVEGDTVVIKVMNTGPAADGGIPLCSVERDQFIAKIPEPLEMSSPGEFRLSKSRISGNKIRVLVGWKPRDCEGGIYEPWQEVHLDQ